MTEPDPSPSYRFEYLPAHHTLIITITESFQVSRDFPAYLSEVTALLDKQSHPIRIINDMLHLRTTSNEMMSAVELLTRNYDLFNYPMLGDVLLVTDKQYIQVTIEIMGKSRQSAFQWGWVETMEEAYRQAGIPIIPEA